MPVTAAASATWAPWRGPCGTVDIEREDTKPPRLLYNPLAPAPAVPGFYMSGEPQCPRVAVLGLDGATFLTLDPLIDSGALPNFARMRAEGVRGRLRATSPPNSPLGWAAFMTGRNAGKHGLFGFFTFEPERYRLGVSTGARVAAPTLWEIASRRGVRSAVVNVPYSYPPRAVDGVTVSGMDTPHGRPFTNPPPFEAELLAAVPDYRIEMDLPRGTDARKAWILERGLDYVRARARAFDYVRDHVAPQLFVGVFTATDRIHHFLWADLDAAHPRHDPALAPSCRELLEDVYREIDAELGRLIDWAGDDGAVFILSDHGFSGVQKTFFVHHWLHGRGLLALAERQRADTSMTLLRFLRARPRLYDAAREVKRRIPGLKQREMSRRSIGASAPYRKIDWSRTRAFYINNQGFRVNLAGREPGGIVDPADYEALRDELIAAAREIRDPQTGAPVYATAVRREELYSGGHEQVTADVVLVEVNGRERAAENFSTSAQINPERLDRLFAARGIPGNHADYGVLMARGAGIRRGAVVEGAALQDLAPTILHYLGLPVPLGMDGRVLDDALAVEFTSQHRVERCDDDEGEYAGDGLESDDEADIEERLRGLGYL